MIARPAVLSVHVLDPRGEEGLLADAAVCRELQCRPLAVCCAVSSRRPEPLPAESIVRQLDAAMGGQRPAAARVGLLCDPDQVRVVADFLDEAALGCLVLAPVPRLAGTNVMDEATLAAVRERLYPRAAPLMVRAADLELVAGRAAGDLEEIKRTTATLRTAGAGSVLVTGVVRRGRVIDLLDDGGHIGIYDVARVAAPRIPGLAAAHAAALSCHLALGHALPKAVDLAQRYIAVRLQRGA